MTDWISWGTAACFWVAGNIFCIASIVQVRKGYIGAGFRNVIAGLICFGVAALVLP